MLLVFIHLLLNHLKIQSVFRLYVSSAFVTSEFIEKDFYLKFTSF